MCVYICVLKDLVIIKREIEKVEKTIKNLENDTKEVVLLIVEEQQQIHEIHNGLNTRCT